MGHARQLRTNTLRLFIKVQSCVLWLHCFVLPNQPRLRPQPFARLSIIAHLPVQSSLLFHKYCAFFEKVIGLVHIVSRLCVRILSPKREFTRNMEVHKEIQIKYERYINVRYTSSRQNVGYVKLFITRNFAKWTTTPAGNFGHLIRDRSYLVCSWPWAL